MNTPKLNILILLVLFSWITVTVGIFCIAERFNQIDKHITQIERKLN